MKQSLKKFVNFLNRAPHNYLASTQSFLELNLEKMKDDLRLIEHGRMRGQRGEPASDSTTFDPIEQSIITTIEAERKRNTDIFNSNMQTYGERLFGLDLEGYSSEIKTHAHGAISEFKAQVHQGLDELYELRRDVLEVEREFDRFRNKHRLERTAHYPESQILHWGIILVLLLVEIVANGFLLAKGLEFGIAGGLMVAVLIAFVNVVALGILWGGTCLRLVFHRHIALKLLGIFGTGVYFLFAGVLNLSVAHYRDALGGGLPEEAERLAIESLMTNPFGVVELQSWLMLVVGFSFSVIAAVDRLSMDDWYPGYGKTDRKRRRTVADYVREKDHLLGELAETREECVELMQQAKEDLRKRRGEYSAILEGRTRMQQGLQTHLTYLEGAANELLLVYHEANREARDSTEVPSRFSERWQIEVPGVEADTVQRMSSEQLDRIVTDTNATLEQTIAHVHADYDNAVTGYKRIDELAEEDLSNGP